jgi:hypothetical protein
VLPGVRLYANVCTQHYNVRRAKYTDAFLLHAGGIQLAVTCALEHFTALLAQEVLGPDSPFGKAHPMMGALWRWHAAEENEHASVAFDVFRAIDGSYRLRIGVMASATLTWHVALFGGDLGEGRALSGDQVVLRGPCRIARVYARGAGCCAGQASTTATATTTNTTGV